MKSKYWLYGILALAIIGVIVISGCVQQQSNQTENELIQISQDNFYFLEQRWFNSIAGIIERHNGSIEVKSKVGEGATFTIKLPMETKGK